MTFLWLSDPDTTAHARGMEAAATRESLALVDAEIGRVEDALQAKGLSARTNVIVTSDHGFSTHQGRLQLSPRSSSRSSENWPMDRRTS